MRLSATIFKRHSALFAFCFFILISVGYFLPTVLVMGHKLIGDNDAWPIYAQQITIHNQLISDGVVNALVYVIKNIFELSTIRALFSLLFGDLLAYNLVWLGSYIFAGLGAFLLARYLTKNFWGSMIAGFVFSFAPLHVAYSMGFGGATHLEFIPFYVLFFFKLFDTGRLRYLVPAVIFFALIAVNEVHFAVATLLLSAGLIIYYALARREVFKNKRLMITLGVGIALSFLLLITKYSDWINIATSQNNYLNPGLEQAVNYSNDAVGFLTPASAHPIWGSFFADHVANTFTGNPAEYSAYVGFAALILALIGWRSRKHDVQVRLWIILLAAFAIFSLGPFLHFLGTVKPSVPLPYLFLYHYVPFLENMRTVGRLFVIGLLSLSVLSAFGFSYLLEKKFSGQNTKRRLLLGITLLLLIEFLPSTVTNSVTVPAAYKKLGNEPGDFSVIELPIISNYLYASKVKYYNTFHNKNVIGKFDFARKNWERQQADLNTPGINNLLYFIPSGKENSDIIYYDYSRIAQPYLSEQNIRYIIVDKQFVGEGKQFLTLEQYNEIKKFIETNLSVINKEDTRDTLVYELDTRPLPKQLYLTLGDNWSDLQYNDDRVKYRTLQSNSTVLVKNFSTTDENAEIDITLRTTNDLATLDVIYGNRTIGRQEIGPYLKTVRLDFDAFPGEHELTFVVHDPETNDSLDLDKYPVTVERIQTSENPIEADVLESIGTANYTASNILWYPFASHDQSTVDSARFLTTDDLMNRLADAADGSPLVIKNNEPFLRDLLSQPIQHQIDTTARISHDLYATGYYAGLVRRNLAVQNIQYLVVDKRYLSNQEIAYIDRLVTVADPAFKKLFNAKQYTLYQLSSADQEPYAYIDKNWGSISNSNDRELKRYVKNDATLVLNNPSAKTTSATLDFWSFTCSTKKTYLLTLSQDRSVIGRATIGREHEHVSMPLTNITPGAHELMIALTDQFGDPPPVDDKCTRIYNLNFVNSPSAP
ncbi:MAG: hypothetical protein WC497_01040 [Patescibacteria group bacterium]